MPKPLPSEEFFDVCRKVYDNKYTYDETSYINRRSPITVTCPKHGVFYPNAGSHKNGKANCKACSKENRSNNQQISFETFVENSSVKFNNKYTYKFSGDFKLKESKVDITCNCGEEFTLIAKQHYQYRSGGCKKCQYKNNSINRSTPIEDVRDKLKRFNKLEIVKYTKSSDNIILSCKDHGNFELSAQCVLSNKLNSFGGCPKCQTPTYIEKIVRDILDDYNIDYIYRDRKTLHPKEIDFYIPALKTGIEVGGLYWHSEASVSKNYHINKLNSAIEKGITLLQFFEDEINKPCFKDVIKSKLGLGKRIYARKCIIRDVPTKTKQKFLEDNHLQGRCGSSVNLGLYYDDELVSVMTFSKERVNVGGKAKDGYYELVRFCSKNDFTIVGGFSKLIKHFETTYNPSRILTYADRRYSNGGVYSKCGFTEIHITKPNYFYYKSTEGTVRLNRFGFRKSVLNKKLYHFDPNLSERENMKNHKYFRIFDCGVIRFEKNYENSIK